jgi:hypothetical protein
MLCDSQSIILLLLLLLLLQLPTRSCGHNRIATGVRAVTTGERISVGPRNPRSASLFLCRLVRNLTEGLGLVRRCCSRGRMFVMILGGRSFVILKVDRVWKRRRMIMGQPMSREQGKRRLGSVNVTVRSSGKPEPATLRSRLAGVVGPGDEHSGG